MTRTIPEDAVQLNEKRVIHELGSLIGYLDLIFRTNSHGAGEKGSAFRHKLACENLSHFFVRIGAPDSIIRAYADLYEAFEDLEKGVVRPVFEHGKRKRITRDATDLARVKMQLALGFYLFRLSGCTRNQAKAEVQKVKLPEGLIERLKTGRARGISSVTSWFDQLEEQTFPDAILQRQYDEIKILILKHFSDHPEPNNVIKRKARLWLGEDLISDTPGTAKFLK